MKIFLQSTQAYKFLVKVYKKLFNVPKHPLQKLKTTEGYNYVDLGSNYGGWSFVEEEGINGCTIISAGLGEDASFDVEFASKYNAKVIIVDPTPRAIKHFNNIHDSLGRDRSEPYSRGGNQPIHAYDLSNVNEDNFQLIKKALWNNNENLKFYEPPNPKHVSYSAINFQSNYSKETNFIEVQAITLDQLLKDINLDTTQLYLIKLDIEGAQFEVIKHFLSKGIFPKQILVELDELNVPSTESFKRVTETNFILGKYGYEMIKNDGNANFLYYKNDEKKVKN